MDRLKAKRIKQTSKINSDLVRVLIRNLDYLTPMVADTYVIHRKRKFPASEEECSTYSLCPRCGIPIDEYGA